jgi:hypothetical protein
MGLGPAIGKGSINSLSSVLFEFTKLLAEKQVSSARRVCGPGVSSASEASQNRVCQALAHMKAFDRPVKSPLFGLIKALVSLLSALWPQLKEQCLTVALLVTFWQVP